MERLHLFALLESTEIFGQQLALLNSDLRQLRMSFRIVFVGGLDTLVANSENIFHTRYPIEFVYFDTVASSEKRGIYIVDGNARTITSVADKNNDHPETVLKF